MLAVPLLQARQRAPHLGFCAGRGPLCWFLAVWVRPQGDLGVVRLPVHQVARLSGVLGVLVGQLFLEEGLEREAQMEESPTKGGTHNGGPTFPGRSTSLRVAATAGGSIRILMKLRCSSSAEDSG